MSNHILMFIDMFLKGEERKKCFKIHIGLTVVTFMVVSVTLC